MFLAIVLNLEMRAAVSEEGRCDTFLLRENFAVPSRIRRHLEVQRERRFVEFLRQTKTKMRISTGAGDDQILVRN